MSIVSTELQIYVKCCNYTCQKGWCKGLVSYTDSPAPMRMRPAHAAVHYPMHLHNSACHIHVHIVATGSTTGSLYILALVL